MDYEKFENEVKKVINSYGAPENITEEIENFLFQSGNIYSIIELVKELEE